MVKSKDLFSEQATRYAQFRPTYPAELFKYLASLTSEHKLAWDCGCGSGQAAVKLADYFERVIATDSSGKQLENAIRHPKVTYRQASAESSGIEDGSVDLTVAAQSFHWFDRDKFYAEVQRVSKSGGVLAIWCYGLAKISPEVDTVVRHFYGDILGPCWEKERKLVEEGYRGVTFPFQEIKPPKFEMVEKWSLDQLAGYLEVIPEPNRDSMGFSSVRPELVEGRGGTILAVRGSTGSPRTAGVPEFLAISP